MLVTYILKVATVNQCDKFEYHKSKRVHTKLCSASFFCFLLVVIVVKLY